MNLRRHQDFREHASSYTCLLKEITSSLHAPRRQTSHSKKQNLVGNRRQGFSPPTPQWTWPLQEHFSGSLYPPPTKAMPYFGCAWAQPQEILLLGSFLGQKPKGPSFIFCYQQYILFPPSPMLNSREWLKMLGKPTCSFYSHIPCAYPPSLLNVAFQILDSLLQWKKNEMFSLNQINSCFYSLTLLHLPFCLTAHSAGPPGIRVTWKRRVFLSKETNDCWQQLMEVSYIWPVLQPLTLLDLDARAVP